MSAIKRRKLEQPTNEHPAEAASVQPTSKEQSKRDGDSAEANSTQKKTQTATRWGGALTKEQEQAYAKEGFVVLEDFLSQEEVEALRKEAQALVQAEADTAEALTSAGCVVEPLVSGSLPAGHPARTEARSYSQKRLRRLASLMSEEQWMAYKERGGAKHVLGLIFGAKCSRVARALLHLQQPSQVGQQRPSVPASDTNSVFFFNEHFVVKPPYSSGSAFSWHRDAVEQLMMCLDSPFKSPYLSFWCALTDMNEENGTLVVAPGSQRLFPEDLVPSCHTRLDVQTQTRKPRTSSSPSCSDDVVGLLGLAAEPAPSCQHLPQQSLAAPSCQHPPQQSLAASDNQYLRQQYLVSPVQPAEAKGSSKVSMPLDSDPSPAITTKLTQTEQLLAVQSGSVVVFSSLLWHRSLPNLSAQHRCAYYLQFSPVPLTVPVRTNSRQTEEPTVVVYTSSEQGLQTQPLNFAIQISVPAVP
eukprot:gb/GEZN01005781.1/.p1 GENE.gb/GEZN01005781.1/~~gb/GEZN01005781.1/.p1  ORF type:complete len:470 (-),score=66.48 gb/GEZN01005781.1/:77-1486(-)